MGDFVIRNEPSREVVRLKPDGQFVIEPDITAEEMRSVFPILVQEAARLLKLAKDCERNHGA